MMTLIVGTNRPDSNTRKVARHVEDIYAALKVPLHILDLAQMPTEIFSISSYAEKPPAFRPFTDAVLKSSGLIIVTPEYNGGIPGVLKYFIDMLKFPESFQKRPVCFVGLSAGVWGGIAASRTTPTNLRLSQRLYLSRARFYAPNQQSSE